MNQHLNYFVFADLFDNSSPRIIDPTTIALEERESVFKKYDQSIHLYIKKQVKSQGDDKYAVTRDTWLGIGNTSQHQLMDMYKLIYQKQGSCFLNYDKLSKRWDISLHPFLLADIISNQEIGHTFKTALEDKDEAYKKLLQALQKQDWQFFASIEDKEEKFKQALEYKKPILYDESQFLLLYGHIQNFASTRSYAKTTIHFITSSWEMLTNLSLIFKKFPTLIPKHINLRLTAMMGPELELDLQSNIQGTGYINYDYRHTIEEIAKYQAEHFPKYSFSACLLGDKDSTRQLETFIIQQHGLDSIMPIWCNHFDWQAFTKMNYLLHYFLIDYDGALATVRKQDQDQIKLDMSTEIDCFQKEMKQMGILFYINKHLGRVDSSIPVKNAWLGIGTARQDEIIDLWNFAIHQNGSSFFTFIALSIRWNIPLNSFLMADIRNKKALGSSLETILADKEGLYKNLVTALKEKNKTFIDSLSEKKGIALKTDLDTYCITYDGSKALLVYAHIQQFASQHPEEKAIIHFMDDRSEILVYLAYFFKTHPKLIPRNISLQLVFISDSGLQKYQIFHGSGTVNYHYQDTILVIAKHLQNSDLIERLFKGTGNPGLLKLRELTNKLIDQQHEHDAAKPFLGSKDSKRKHMEKEPDKISFFAQSSAVSPVTIAAEIKKSLSTPLAERLQQLATQHQFTLETNSSFLSSPADTKERTGEFLTQISDLLSTDEAEVYMEKSDISKKLWAVRIIPMTKHLATFSSNLKASDLIMTTYSSS